MRHAEVAFEQLLCVASSLMPDYHNRFAVEASPPGDDRRVIAKRAIAMQLDEISKNQIYQLGRERTLWASRNLNPLERREVAVDLVAQLAKLLLERCDFIRDVHLSFAGEPLQLVDLYLQLCNRFFEIQRLGGCRQLSAPALQAHRVVTEQRAQLAKRGRVDRKGQSAGTQRRPQPVAI